jgi:type IV pilus secretin PilQ/predicted competence protein
MHVNELDIRQLLELLSRRSRMNILVSPKVTGVVTANFEGVTVDQVLRALIKLADLTEKQEGSIHYIYTKAELQDEAEFTKKERILTRVYKLNYVRSDELLGIIRPFLSADVGQRRLAVSPSYRFGISESATFVSGGGQAMSAGGISGGGAGVAGPGGAPPSGGGPTIAGFQPPTGGNSLSDFDHLIVQDYESNLKIVDQIIERIDVRPVQVLIEAVIVSVDLEHDRQLGVNFGVVDNLAEALGEIGSGTALNGNVGFTPAKLLTATGKIAQSAAATDPTGFTSAAEGIKFGFVANNVTGFVRALETIGSTKILASPRVLVLNKQRAEIQLGARLGFQTLSQNFTSTIQQVQFLNTGTLLRLRPFVSDDGMVRMEIHPERSSGVVTNNIPNQQTAELTTNVMVPDGATLVIGGLMEDQDEYQMQGLPLLSRLPALGYLFGVRQKSEGRRELVVLLTPHIWSPELAMAHGPIPRAHASVESPDASAAAAAGARDGAPESSMSLEPAPRSPIQATTVSTANSGATTAAARPRADSGVSAEAAPGAGPPSDPERQAASPASQGRWPYLRRLFARRSVFSGSDPAQAPGQRFDGSSSRTSERQPGGDRGGAVPVDGGVEPASAASQGEEPAGRGREIDRNLSAPGGVTTSLRAARSDAMVARAGYDTPPARDRDEPGPGQHAGRPDVEREDHPAMTPSSARDESGFLAEPSRVGQPSWRPPGVRPGAVVAGPWRHTVVPGDRFESVAKLYYGSEQYADALWRFNRGRFPRPYPLKAGDLIVIPPVEELDATVWRAGRARAATLPALTPVPKAAESNLDLPRTARPRQNRSAQTANRARDGSAVRAGGSGPGPADSGEPAAPLVHVVRRYETLRSIARDRLGDARRADEIRDLNVDRLSEAGQLSPGVRLLVPPDAGRLRPVP